MLKFVHVLILRLSLACFADNKHIREWIIEKLLRMFYTIYKGVKKYMFTFKKSDNLEIIGYSDSDFSGCVDSKKFTSGYIFMIAGGPIS
jgi:hypothetical protein